jgi:hypothetical protein
MTLPTIKVTEEDREAAIIIVGGIWTEADKADIRACRRDSLSIIQAFAAHRLSGYNQGVAEERERSEELIDRYTTALHEIVQWADAYPLKVFPEPDFAVCAAALKEVGQTLDAVSASNMRHVVEGVGRIARTAIRSGEA